MTAIRKRQWKNASGKTTTKYLVDYKDSSGRRRSKQFPRRKDAEEWRVAASFEVSQGTHTADSQSITVAAAADLWMKRAENQGRERSTLHGYDNLSRLHVIPFIGAIKLSKLTRPMVEKFRDDLEETRSAAMTGKAIRALSSVLNEAMRRGLVAQNVAQGVKLDSGKARKAQVVIPTRPELKAIIAACYETDLPLILTAVFTGLRASELRGLRWADVDLDAGKLSVNQRADLWNTIGPPKSSAGYRAIPMPEILVKELGRWKLTCPHSVLDLVFPNTRGTVFGYPNLLRRVFFPVQVRAGLTRLALTNKGESQLDKVGKPILNGKYGFHALRHAAASGWIDQNIDLKRLQTWMGHESVQITLDTYGHLIKDDAKDAAIAEAAQASLLG